MGDATHALWLYSAYVWVGADCRQTAFSIKSRKAVVQRLRRDDAGSLIPKTLTFVDWRKNGVSIWKPVIAPIP